MDPNLDLEGLSCSQGYWFSKFSSVLYKAEIRCHHRNILWTISHQCGTKLPINHNNAGSEDLLLKQVEYFDKNLKTNLSVDLKEGNEVVSQIGSMEEEVK